MVISPAERVQILKAENRRLEAYLRELSKDQWQHPSPCEAWTIADVVAHITLDWPAWSQAAYRQWYVDEVLERLPAIEVEVVFRAQNLESVPTAPQVADASPETSPLIGSDRLERVGITMETSYGSTLDDEAGDEAQRAVEVTYEGLYELVEETLADGTNTQLDEHFGALGGWIASTLVRLADLR